MARWPKSWAFPSDFADVGDFSELLLQSWIVLDVPILNAGLSNVVLWLVLWRMTAL